MAFLTEPEPVRGQAHRVAERVLRLVARNPGRMTYHGTNTYLIEDPAGFFVLDPGPTNDPQHVDDIIEATGGQILLSHGHHDHAGALADLRDRTGSPTYAFPDSIAADFTAEVSLRHGDRVGPLLALHTPGHAPDHLCFAREDGVVFTADHVMGWSSSVVSPPMGDMRAYVDSLQAMIDRDDRVYLPGHGPALPQPRAYVVELRRRRIAREEEILAALQRGPMSAPDLSRTLYAKVDPILQSAAERNVMSHLQKLWAEGKVEEDDETWIAV
jgi:glyoxylase-like metal-dependent hydrolase (beta-lactamase superfamily II)